MPDPTLQPTPADTHEIQALKHDVPLISCRLDPSGAFAFAGAQDNRVWRFSLADGKKVELAAHDSWVRAIGFVDEGRTLITGGYDGRLIWWPATVEQPKPLRTVDAHQGWIRALAVSPDRSRIATVGNDLVVRLWSAEGGERTHEFSGHGSHVYNVAFHPDGKSLATGDLKGNVLCWDFESGKLVRTLTIAALTKYDEGFRADIGGTRDLAFSADGKTLAASGITNVTNAFAGEGNPIVVEVDWETGQERVQHVGKGGPRGVAWRAILHPSGFVITASGGGSGGLLLFWKPGEKEEFHRLALPSTARDLDLSADGLTLATAQVDGHVRVFKMTPKAA